MGWATRGGTIRILIVRCWVGGGRWAGGVAVQGIGASVGPTKGGTARILIVRCWVARGGGLEGGLGARRVDRGLGRGTGVRRGAGVLERGLGC